MANSAPGPLDLDHAAELSRPIAVPGRRGETSAPDPASSQERRRIAAALARLAGHGAYAPQLADVLVSTLHDIDAALSPVIGKGGVAALYKRSVYLVAAADPSLVGSAAGAGGAFDMAALKAALEARGPADAAAAGGALLHTLYELLASLIGPALADRLLRPTWAKFLADWPPKDGPP